jgi:hypothetical protein
LLDKLGITGVPDVYEIAAAVDVPVREIEATSFEGALVRVKGQPRGIIAINRAIRELGRKNFTIAHELAHLILPGHDDSTVCASGQVENWGTGEKAKEVDANRFAAELLLPEVAVRRTVGSQTPGFGIVALLAHTFTASLTAAAYRFVELSSFRCAVVWSARGQVRWFKASDEFGQFVRIRERVDARSFASDCLAGQAVPEVPEAVSADVWLSGAGFDQEATILEESRAMPTYDGVLTLLWIRESIEHGRDEDPEDALQPLDPSEFTVGRRRWPHKR